MRLSSQKSANADGFLSRRIGISDTAHEKLPTFVATKSGIL
jgi:hypothetical protein